MADETVIGHKAIVSHFSTLVGTGALSHAYCFVGPHGLGKRTVVNRITAELLGSNYSKVESNPDYFLVTRSIDEKTGLAKTEISVAQARTLRSTLREKPWGNGYRVAVIDEAETLSNEAANALLKIVEEPPEKTILFFLVDRVENIPVTIRSRTEVFYFSLVREAEIASALVAKGIETVKAGAIAELAWGRPGRALELATDEEFFGKEIELAKIFKKLLIAPASQRNAILEQLTEKKDGTRVAEEMANVLDTWLMTGRGMLRREADDTRVAHVIDSLHEAKVMLRQNVNPRLILENIFLTY